MNEKKEEPAEEIAAVNVSPDQYLSVQLAQIDDKIAELELTKAQADLKIAQLKKEKTQAIIDFQFSQLNALKNKSPQPTLQNEKKM